MKPETLILSTAIVLLFSAGCSTARLSRSPEMAGPTAQFSKAPDWDEIDRSLPRIEERKQTRSDGVQVTETVEHGFLPMSDDDYRDIRREARADVRKENPELSRREIEREATRRANKTRRDYENSPTTRATWTWKRTLK